MLAGGVEPSIDECQYGGVSTPLTVLDPVEPDPVAAMACCPPLTREPLSPAQADQLVPLLKALADPVRLRLLSLVASHAGGEACVCDLNVSFALSQPTISHHLKVLHTAGLLERSKRGTWVYYRVRDGALADLAAVLAPADGSPQDCA